MLIRHRTVFVGDDDASGLIFFAMYFHYMAEGDQELFESIGHPIWRDIEEGQSGPAVNSTCDYLAPARAGDRLEQTIRLVVGNRSSVRTDHEWVLPSGAVAARGSITRCWVDLETMEKVAFPDWIAEHADGRMS